MNQFFLRLAFFMLTISFSTLGFSQAMQKGDVTIEPYYGFPNFGKHFAGLAAPEDINVTGLGPWGVRMGFLPTESFSITFDFIHNSFGDNYTEVYTEWDEDDNLITQEYIHRVRMNRYRFLVGFNYHFEIDTETDAYIGFAGGSNRRIESLDPGGDPNVEPINDEVAISPVAFRLRLGGRYFFTPNVAGSVELGLGGPLVSLGIIIRPFNSSYHYDE